MRRNERFIRSRLRRRAIAPLVVVLPLWGADGAAAQAGRLIYRSIPEKGDTTHLVVPGGRFKANRLHRWIYGSPFHEAAAVGGSGNLRGFRKDRFAGESALYGNGELRVRLTRIYFLFPGELGAFAAVDAGRVFFKYDPKEADDWHTGTGGGLWVSFLKGRATLSAARMYGEDLTGWYLRAGLMF